MIKNWFKYPFAYSVKDLKPNKVYQSWLNNKKLVIRVVKGNKSKIIHFGDPNYSNYGIHKSKLRLKNYLNRSAGIRNKKGELTYKNPFYANYWSRKILWNKNINK